MVHGECRFPQRAVRLLLWRWIENKQIDRIISCHLIADNRARVSIMLVENEANQIGAQRCQSICYK
jgi:hypothetical protein